MEKLAQKYDEERKRNYEPIPKYKNNLDYFKNNEPVKISKYSFKAKNTNNINNAEGNLMENFKENKNQKKISLKTKFKRNMSTNNNNPKNITYNNIDMKDNNSINNSYINENKNKKIKKIKTDPLLKYKIKLTKKEIEDLSNKLHYDGELLKIKKQAMINEDFENNSNYHSFSKEKLNHSSIIILIKKFLYEYSTSVQKNAYIDYTKNPKLNYEQYIDILKDLNYLRIDALPDDYLEEDSMYKELWNKLSKFSSGPENSIESNVFLLYLLELNGFFSNEKIKKVLKNKLYWIKLEEYDDLIANSKYIEENWGDLKGAKISNIKKLKLERNYNPNHSIGIYNNFNNNNISKINSNSFINTKHYITTLKGYTNYHMIHGYNSSIKNNEDSFLFSKSFNKNEDNKYNSFSISYNSHKKMKKFKNRIPLKDSYNDFIRKRKKEIENKKKDEEEKIKEMCTFKPQTNVINKNVFSNTVKVELPKYKRNKSFNLYNNLKQENNTNNNINYLNYTLTKSNQIEDDNNNDNNINIRGSTLKKYNNHNYLSIKDLKENKSTNTNTKKNSSHSPILRDKKKLIKQNILKRNNTVLQKMFDDNPLKNDKAFNDKIQQLKMGKANGTEFENYNNNLVRPMRFDIEYPNKFESLGFIINKEMNKRQKTQNVIFYNIKINDKIKTLKYIEGDNLKLDVINFVKKNKLPEEVINIIMTKIKEKTNEENLQE